MKNLEIRDKARIANVHFWQIARKLGCNATTFSVWLREELPDEKRQRILDVIDELVAERAKGVEG